MLNLPAGLRQGFTQRREVRKGRKEGPNEGHLLPLRPSRTLPLCVKPSGAAGAQYSPRKFKLYHYRRRMGIAQQDEASVGLSRAEAHGSHRERRMTFLRLG
jgi:hypothetical protein